MKRLLAAILTLLLAAPVLAAASPPSSASIVVRRVLALRLPESARTRLLPRDPVLAAVVDGAWRPPRAGERVPVRPDSAAVWIRLAADKAGWFRHEALESGWAYAAVTVPQAGVWLLEAGNHEYVFVNGEPRAGNKYQTKDDFEAWEPRHDYSCLPVALRAGRNDLLFRCDRGGLKVVLRRPSKPVLLNARDLTAPDLVVGEPLDTWAAIPIVNTTEKTLTDLEIVATLGDSVTRRTPLPPIPPLTVRKVGFKLAGPSLAEDSNNRTPAELPLVVQLRAAVTQAHTVDEFRGTLRVAARYDLRKVTFVSGIDGSVQYYAELPPKGQPGGSRGQRRDIVLTLHGANVEARNQAASYAPKSWARIIAPTNRRPYGFSWEDWGRLDALEVLEQADEHLARERPEHPQVWLTGHSMGGHGAWILGALYPDRFAAIGPSAGWATFWTYRYEYDRALLSPAEKMLTRASNASETMQLAPNLARLGVYCLHGGVDDNVPPAQSHLLIDALKTFHSDWTYHEEPGQGHWWDLSPEPGTDCVDWPPMFEFFARRVRLPEAACLEIDFRTASPGVSSSCAWVEIRGQERQHELSRVHVRCLPESGRVIGETENVSELGLSVVPIGWWGGEVTVELDGQVIPPCAIFMDAPPGGIYERRNGRWSCRTPVVTVNRDDRNAPKSSRRYGPFKDAFRHRFQFVVGTRGTAQQNAWAAAKARFDAETWWYQGNGEVDIVRDVDFDAAAEPDRGVILYGNAQSNAAWVALLPDCPVRVEPGAVTLGGRRLAGDDLACLFVRPRPRSYTACVAVVAGTGPAGQRLTDTLPYLQAGFALPDCCVLSPRILTEGDRGIRVAGFFGADWSIEQGEFLWNE